MRLRWTMPALLAALLMGLIRTTHADGVDDYLKAQMAARHIPGLSVAVVQDGKVVKSQGYGLANIELPVPAAVGTIYPIGSISKQFTAVAVMLLAQEQKVGLDDPISKYLASLPATWQSITVRELLNQTSGIPEWVPDPDKDPLLKTYSLTELAHHAAVKPLAFRPGTRFEYSNTNYNLLAGIVEKAGGKPLNDFLQEHLFKPLGMDATGEYDPQMAVQSRSAGYTRAAGNIYNNIIFYDPSILAGAGGLQSTVGDLAKWDAAVASGEVLPLPVMAQMWTPPVLPGGAVTDYGMGWMSQSVKGHRMIWHNGAIPGCMGFSGRFPDDHLSVVILSNMCPIDRFDDSPPFFSLGLGVAKQYLPDLAKEEAAVPDTNPQVTRLLRRTLLGLAAGKVDADTLTLEMRSVFSPETLTQMRQAIAPLEPLQSLSLLAHSEQGSLTVYRYRAVYGATPTIVLMTLTPDGKIAGWLGPRLE